MPVSLQQGLDRAGLALHVGRAQLEHLATPVSHQICLTGLLGNLADQRLCPLTCPSPVKRLNRAFVLDPYLPRDPERTVVAGDEVGCACHLLTLEHHRRLVLPGLEQLKAVVAEIGDRLGTDHAARDSRRAAGHTGDQLELGAQVLEAFAGLDRDLRPFRAVNDPAQRPVDITHQGRSAWFVQQNRERRVLVHGRSIAGMESGRYWRLALIGTVAGAFSGLFGVGGGTVIVPMLIAFFAFGERLATGTSLAAIVLIAILAAALQGGAYGNVDISTGLLLVLPAILGVIAGTAIQQRIPEKAVSLIFAGLLVAVAVEMVVG